MEATNTIITILAPYLYEKFNDPVEFSIITTSYSDVKQKSHFNYFILVLEKVSSSYQELLESSEGN